MAPNSTKTILRVIAELFIVFAGAVGVAGIFLDYYWLTEPEIITNKKIALKYFIGLLAVIAHGILIQQRLKHIESNNRKEN